MMRETREDLMSSLPGDIPVIGNEREDTSLAPGAHFPVIGVVLNGGGFRISC
jgi:hypothetical protein